MAKKGTITEAEKRALVTARVSYIFSMSYLSTKKWLDADPNDFDADPSPFYNAVQNTFRLAPPKNRKASFNGLGGTVRSLIAEVVARWKPPYELEPEGPLDIADP